MTRPITGLVLTGGGARAAYQVGALRALHELLGPAFRFDVVAGASAGAINSIALASHADDFGRGMSELYTAWRSLAPERVYRTDFASLVSIGATWIRQLSSGGLFGPARVNALLDTAPLRALLCDLLPASRIREHVAQGRLRGAAVTATNYHTGTATTFFDAVPEVAPWVRSSRLGIREALTVDHVLASAAIPVFFPPVSLEGAWFGDGCVRLTAPLSPAIHLGAERILAIGIRYQRKPEETIQLNQDAPARTNPTVSEIAGVLLNALFLDSLEADVERMLRINATLSLLTREQHGRMQHPLRRIPLLSLRPSRDLGSLAVEQYRRFPKTLRHLLRGIGATGDTGWDLVSYLAFEPDYLEHVMELGYEDTHARRAEIEGFFDPAPDA